MPQIPEYNEMTSSPAGDDLLAIIDVSADNEFKKIQFNNLIGNYVSTFNGRSGAVALTEADLTGVGVQTFNGRHNHVTLLSSDLNGLNGSGLVGIGSGTGGLINTGSTTIGADSDSDGVGAIALQTRGLTRFEVRSDGTLDFHNSPIANFGGGGGAVTPGSVLFADGAGLATGDHANFAYDVATQRFSLGTTSPLAKLHLVDTTGAQYGVLIETTQTNNDLYRSYGLRVAATMLPAGSGVPTNYAIFGQLIPGGTSGNVGNLTGVRGVVAMNAATVHAQQIIGVGAACAANANCTLDPVSNFSSIGVDIDTLEVGGGTVTISGSGFVAGIRILRPFTYSGGSISGAYLAGIYIEDFYGAGGTWANEIYGIFSGGGSNYFGGNVCLFQSTPGFGADRKILFIGDVTTPPASNYTNGFALYSSNSKHAFMYRYASAEVPIVTLGMQGTPTLSGFGAGKSLAAGSIGAAGEIDVGTSAGTSGTITFAFSWYAAPFVSVHNRTSNIPLTYQVTTSSIVITSSSAFNDHDKIVWIARGSQ